MRVWEKVCGKYCPWAWGAKYVTSSKKSQAEAIIPAKREAQIAPPDKRIAVCKSQTFVSYKLIVNFDSKDDCGIHTNLLLRVPDGDRNQRKTTWVCNPLCIKTAYFNAVITSLTR